MKRILFLLKILWERSLFILARPYHYVRNWWPLWFYILNREGRKLYNQNPTQLTDLQKRLAEDLTKNGITSVHISELFPEREELFSELQKYAKELGKTGKTRKAKPFLVSFTDVPPVLNPQDPLVGLALEERVLQIVSAYLGVYPKFDLYSLDLTLPVPQGTERIKSQRWHRDPEDKKMCKMFLYFNDVDETAGPFNYIPQSNHGGKWRNTFPQRPPKGFYPELGAVEKIIPSDQIKICTGKAGTIVFADTSGLHRGGYATAKERLMFTAGFSTGASIRPADYLYPESFEESVKRFSSIANYALKRRGSFAKLQSPRM